MNEVKEIIPESCKQRAAGRRRAVQVGIEAAIENVLRIEIRNDVENSIWAVTYPAVHGPIVMAVRAHLYMRSMEGINDYR